MARRARGRPVHGWLVLDKPAGVSSAAAVAKAKWALDAAKAGHAGTLDPAATGLLAIAFGEATKTVPFVADARKAYRFTVRWGAATATDDAEGAVVATSALRPDAQAIRAALPEFTGEIMQVPPQVSAVKVDGERAYARVRAGEVARPRGAAADRRAARAGRGARRRHRQLRAGLRQGRLRAQHRPRPRRSGSAASATSPRCGGSGPGRSRSTARSAGTRSRPRRARPALAARLLPVRAALGGLPELVCPPSAAARLLNGNPVALPGAALARGRHRLGEPRRRAARGRHLARRRAAPEPGLRAAMSAGGGWRERARRLGARGRAADARGAAGARRLRLAVRRARRPDRRGRDPTASTPASCWRCAARPIRPTRSAPAGSRSSAATSPRSAASACWCS